MFEAQIVGTGEGSGYGNFNFGHMPSPGDRIVIGNSQGSLDILRVLWIEHHPVKIPTPKTARLGAPGPPRHGLRRISGQ